MNRTISADVFKILGFVILVIYSIARSWMGIDFTDSPYMLISALDAPQRMLVGFNLLTQAWVRCFGETYLSIRLFQAVFGLGTCLIPYFGLVPRTEWLKRLHWLLLGLILWNTRPFSFHCDIPSLLFVSLAGTLAISYYRSGAIRTYLLLIVASAAAILCRFPDIVLVVILGLLLPLAEIFWMPKENRRFGYDKPKLLIFGGCAILVLILPFCFGTNPVTLTQTMIRTVSGAFSGTHTLEDMLAQMQRDMVSMLLFGGGILFLMMVARRFCSFRYPIFGILVILYPLLKLLIFFIFSDYNQSMRTFTGSILVVLFGSVMFDSFQKKDKRAGLELMIVFLFGFVSMAGSNTGCINGIATWTTFVAPMSIYLSPKIAEYFPKKQYGWLYGGIYLICVLLSTMQGFEDERYWRLTETIQTPKQTAGLRTTPDKAQLIRDVLADYEAVQSKGEVVFFGTRSHLFCWLTGQRRPFSASFWMFPTETADVQPVENYLAKGKCGAFFIIPSEPHALQMVSCPADQQLSKRGYKLVMRNGYRLYIRP